MLNTNLFLKLTRHERSYPGLGPEHNYLEIRPAVICADGFQISIQASEHHYCAPRNNMAKEYESVELGFPSEKEDLIMEYVEDDQDPTGTVYGWVPVEVVDKMLEKHGGIVDIRNAKE